jgi:tetratricopeptide (TPR) repeat protein
MAMEERKLLESWKEISAYLKRSEKTCRRFEASLGLPVHRLDGTPKARVFAYADELDAWLQRKLNHVEEESEKANDGRGRKRIILVFGTLAFVVLAVSGAVLIWHPFSPAPGPILPRNPSLAILPFENPTKDVGLEPWRTALADLLITDLVQSRYVTVVRITDLYRKLIGLKLGETDKFSEEDVRAVADKAGVDYVTTGSLTREGANVALTILIRDPKNPEKARSFRTGYREEQGVFSAVDRLTREIKLAVGLTPRHVSRDIDRDVADISTHSPQAFRLCSQGHRLGGIAKYAESIALLQRAVEIDPKFALAYKNLYRACQNAGRPEEEKKYVKKVIDLSGRLSERERGETVFIYYGNYLINESKQIEALKRMCRFYPQDRWANGNLMGLYTDQESWDKAMAVAEGALPANKSDPGINRTLVKCYQNLGWGEKAAKVLNEFIGANPALRSDRFWGSQWISLFLQMNDLDKALAEAERLATLSAPSSPQPLLRKGTVYFLKGDFPSALGEYRKVLELNDPGAHISALLDIGDLYVMQGRVEEAKGAYRRGLEIVGKFDGDKALEIFSYHEITALHQELSRLLQLTGRFDEALKEIEEALEIYVKATKEDPPLSFLHQKGLILLDMDRMEEFERVTDTVRELAGRWQKPKLMRVYYHLLGHRELKNNDPRKAMEHFWRAVDLVSVPGGGEYGPDPEYFYSLAEACSRLDDPAARLRSFPMYEKVTLPTVNRIHKGDLYAMSFYHMAKCLEDRTGARASLESFKSAKAGAIENYRQFLALWGGADPIFAPLVEDARNRLAALEKQ